MISTCSHLPSNRLGDTWYKQWFRRQHEQRVTFKVLLLTFKALNNLAPLYLSQLIVPYNPTRNLRSAGRHLLEVPNVRLKSYGDRAFSVAAPKHWNEIPSDIKLS